MRRSLLAIPALLTAFAMPLVAVAPASATSPDLSNFTFDCNSHLFNDWYLPLYGTSVTLEFENCGGAFATLVDIDDTGNASTSAATLDDNTPQGVDTVTVVGDVTVTLLDETTAPIASVEFISPYEMPNPTGTQVADSEQTIPLSPDEVSFGTPSEINGRDEITLAGIDECDVIAGPHVYAEQNFAVSNGGDYTFRVTGVTPLPGYFEPLNSEWTPVRDPMVALYSSFDPANPDEGIVGCNDDLNDLVLGGYDYGDNDFNITAQGDYVEGHMPYFEANLDPGDYTLVFTTWDSFSADEWNAGEGAEDEWTAGPATIYFDAWGPAGGLDLTDGPSGSGGSGGPDSLASTGVEPAFALWTAVFMIGSGAAIMVARRRRQGTTHAQ